MSREINSTRPLIFALLLSAMVLITPTQLYASGWSSQIVDSPGNVGQYCFLAIDSKGNPHISYYNYIGGSSGTLKYASMESGIWRIQTIEAFAGGGYTSLALDTNDNPYISYASGYSVKMASLESGTWKSQTVEALPFLPGSTSIALNNNWIPCVAYYVGGGALKLHYASWESSSGKWITKEVDTGLRGGSYVSLAFDGNNKPYISYDKSTTFLWLASLEAGTTWIKQKIDFDSPGAGDDLCSSIAIDSLNIPHVSVTSSISPGYWCIKYISWNPAASTWEVQVHVTSSIPGYTSLALDTNDKPHIAYYDNSSLSLGLKYATLESGTWKIQTVEAGTGKGEYCSIALSNDMPCIAYYDGTNDDLKYAVQEYIPPVVTVEAPSDKDIALEVGSKYRISWEATDNFGIPTSDCISIYLSTNEGISWSIITATEENDPGKTTGTYEWTVPNIPSDKCLISIEARDIAGNRGYDISDNPFTVLRRIVYVSPDGSDEAGWGTLQAPFRTIQKGLDCVAVSGEVRMLPGIYSEVGDHSVIWPARQNITLKLSPEATGSATMDAQGNGRLISIEAAVNLTIEGLTLQNGNTSENGGGIYLQSGSSLWLNQVIVRNCTAEGNNGGAIYSASARVTAKNCAFISNNAVNGGVAYQGTWYPTNCTFYNNNASSNGSIADGGVWTAVNSIFWNNSSSLFTISPSIKYSDIQSSDFVPNTGNISTEPRFVSTDEALPNFLRLTDGSPCIDTGTNETGVPIKDIEGIKRPVRKGYDMGAYEFHGPWISLIKPVNGEVLYIGIPYNIKWIATDEVDNIQVINISLSTDEGSTWNVITSETNPVYLAKKVLVSYPWTPLSWMISTECMLSIEAIDASGEVGKPVGCGGPWKFEIAFSPDTNPPLVTVEAPNGLESLTGGLTYEVKWSATDESGIRVNGITIRFSPDSGVTWTDVTQEVSNTGIFTWEVPSINSSNCRISVEAEDVYGNLGSDISDADFTISTVAPTIDAIYVNNIWFISGDIITSQVSMRTFLIDPNGIASMEVEIDGALKIALSCEVVACPNETWCGRFSIPNNQREINTHILKFKASSRTGTKAELIMTAIVMTGSVQVMGRPLNYPNPFNPNSGTATKIQYTLSVNAPINLIIFDITGHQVKRLNFSSGENGGRAGVNHVTWDGRAITGNITGNGMYIFEIISDNRLIGSGKMVIMD